MGLSHSSAAASSRYRDEEEARQPPPPPPSSVYSTWFPPIVHASLALGGILVCAWGSKQQQVHTIAPIHQRQASFVDALIRGAYARLNDALSGRAPVDVAVLMNDWLRMTLLLELWSPETLFQLTDISVPELVGRQVALIASHQQPLPMPVAMPLTEPLPGGPIPAPSFDSPLDLATLSSASTSAYSAPTFIPAPPPSPPPSPDELPQETMHETKQDEINDLNPSEEQASSSSSLSMQADHYEQQRQEREQEREQQTMSLQDAASPVLEELKQDAS